MSAAAWTHTLTYDDVQAMVTVAEPGMPVERWREVAAEQSRLLAGSRRTTQLRFATTILRPVKGTIVDDGFLTDWHAADDATRYDLAFSRYLSATPLAVAGSRALFMPSVRNGRHTIPRESIDVALGDLLTAQKPETIQRSGASFRREFARAGVVRVERNGSLELTAAPPSRLALLHLIRDDLHERREATDAWLTRHSLAATLYALSSDALRNALEALVNDGRLQRSYYGGEPRILAA